MITREEWDSLRYPISLRELAEDEGGGWHAEIPMLGEGAFVGDGDTAEEAVTDLEDRRRGLYESVAASKRPIPLPVDLTDEFRLPSGKWVMRTSPLLHAELKAAAERSGLSFNAYCNHCLERGHAVISIR